VVDLLTKGDKSFSNLSKVVSDHLSLYRSEVEYVNSVSTDNEPSMIALRHVIQGAGARHVTGGVKSNNLAKIDRQIRLIKDRVRSILHSLPYSLPRKLIPWAVYFAVSRINLLNLFKANQPSPRELFSVRGGYAGSESYNLISLDYVGKAHIFSDVRRSRAVFILIFDGLSSFVSSRSSPPGVPTFLFDLERTSPPRHHSLVDLLLHPFTLEKIVGEEDCKAITE
jgi:hypothetical protein